VRPGPVLEAWCLRIAGGLILVIAIGHLFMPTLGYSPGVIRGMTASVLDHFYYLGTYAICAFLFGFAALALAFSVTPRTSGTRLFSAVMTLVWVTRLSLELAFPVEVRIFVLERPHSVLVVVLLVITLSFFVAALAGAKR
jgi:hypothetical protein